ncbi:fibronectin type III domain-containing protein [candidate division KSB1 bacterium]|nr:fibronectin type III domain-containing protein [candidate division KSB1 bacterium]
MNTHLLGAARFLALAVLVSAIGHNAAFAAVSGIVTDSTSGLPVAQAWVRFGSIDSIQTNGGGAYSLSTVGAGTYETVVRRANYLNRRQTVTLAPGNNTVDFQLVAMTASVNPVGWWTFEDAAHPTYAQVGNDLVLQGTHSVIAGPNGSGAINIGVGSYYRCYHDMPANGGSASWVNEFSIVIDFRVAQLGRWYTFYQTSITNANDGDAFINSGGNIGVGVTGYSAYATVPNEWYRLVISADLGSSYRYYLDGALLQDGGAQVLNGRFALNPANNGNQVLFFADENGEDNPIDIAQVAIYDVSLSGAQAAALGGYGHVISNPADVMTPYLQSPAPTSIMISWHYQPSTQTVVDYGLTEGLGLTATGSAQTIGGTAVWHTVSLTNLQPNTTYFYRCRSDTASTPVTRFHTPPAQGTRSGTLRFMLISDSQTNISRSTEVANAMQQTLLNRFGASYADSIQFVMHCGDILGNGLSLATYQTEYFLPFRQLNQSIPFMVSIGNHEGESSYFYDYMKYDDFAGPEGERYYSFALGRVLFIALNSNTQGTTQANWLNTRLAQAQSDTTIDMIFVSTHHPGHSEVWPDGNTSWTLNTILPMLEGYSKAAMISFGHSHNYERGARANGNLRTLVCGGGGGSLDRWRMYANQTDYPEVHRAFDYNHYVLVEVDLANHRYAATAYSLGNSNMPMADVPFDHWEHSVGAAAPAAPLGVYPTGEVFGSITLIATAPGGPDTVQSSQLQLTATPGSYAAPLMNLTRDFENYYYDSGAPNYTPIDRNAGIQLDRFGPVDSLLDAGQDYGWRIRFRDSNLNWSPWSDEEVFIWYGPDSISVQPPLQLTALASGPHMSLRWRRPAGNVAAYRVYRDVAENGSFVDLIAEVTDTLCVDSNALAHATLRYHYLVKTVWP